MEWWRKDLSMGFLSLLTCSQKMLWTQNKGCQHEKHEKTLIPFSLCLHLGVSMPIPVIGLHNEDKVFVNGSCVLNEERFMLIGSFVAFFIPLVIMVVTYCLTIQVVASVCVFQILYVLSFFSCYTHNPLPLLLFLHYLRSQVLQRQATVFLYEAKTSSQQPLHTPAMTNTLQPPTSTFHLPQINTIAPSDSQGNIEIWFILREEKHT